MDPVTAIDAASYYVPCVGLGIKFVTLRSDFSSFFTSQTAAIRQGIEYVEELPNQVDHLLFSNHSAETSSYSDPHQSQTSSSLRRSRVSASRRHGSASYFPGPPLPADTEQEDQILVSWSAEDQTCTDRPDYSGLDLSSPIDRRGVVHDSGTLLPDTDTRHTLEGCLITVTNIFMPCLLPFTADQQHTQFNADSNLNDGALLANIIATTQLLALLAAFTPILTLNGRQINASIEDLGYLEAGRRILIDSLLARSRMGRGQR
ncbi:hypothetical protein F5Y16DRAFT_245537 [Xylariaceae sp. FL0255]|nr:hypothetical protein F5Y16DRAFT_245537 [Xylariaceae sp. FL0255]